MSMDLAPRLMDLQARVSEMEHLILMNKLTFELILAHPDQAMKLANEAMKRISRAA